MNQRPAFGMRLKAAKGGFFDRNAVMRRVNPAKLKYLRKASGTVRKVARNSIKKKGKSRKPPKRKFKAGTNTFTDAYRRWLDEIENTPASPAGKAPFTHSGLLRDAILFSLERRREAAVIGPTRDLVDDIGELHEFGGVRFGKRYPKRPFMGPALEAVEPKLDDMWRNSVR